MRSELMRRFLALLLLAPSLALNWKVKT